MPAFFIALALAAAPPPSTQAADVAPDTMGAVVAGAAPTDDFGFVSWCAGAVQGYLKLKPAVLPEVRRIEGQFLRPGTTLEEDMQDYAELEKEARRQMRLYQRAIQSAEKGSPTSLSDQGLAGYKRGLAVWAAPAGSTKARIAQEWMSWALPAKCETTAKALTTRSSLFGQALRPTDATGDADAESSAEEEAAPAADPAQTAAAPTDQTVSIAAPVPAKAEPPRKTRAKKKKVKPAA